MHDPMLQAYVAEMLKLSGFDTQWPVKTARPASLDVIDSSRVRVPRGPQHPALPSRTPPKLSRRRTKVPVRALLAATAVGTGLGASAALLSRREKVAAETRTAMQIAMDAAKAKQKATAQRAARKSAPPSTPSAPPPKKVSGRAKAALGVGAGVLTAAGVLALLRRRERASEKTAAESSDELEKIAGLSESKRTLAILGLGVGAGGITGASALSALRKRKKRKLRERLGDPDDLFKSPGG